MIAAPARGTDRTTIPATGVPSLRRLSLQVQGVHCAACVWLLQEIARRSPGALDLRINPARGEADVLMDPERFDFVGFLREADRFGYRFGEATSPRTPESRGLVVRLGLGAAVAMNLMILSLSYYFGLSKSDGIVYTVFGFTALALGTAACILGLSTFGARAWRGVRRGVLTLDVPIAAGIALAYAGSVHAHITAGPEAAYFDSLAAFVVLMILGRWLQERMLERNRFAILDDRAIAGMVTRRVRDGRMEHVPSAAIERGDEIWVVPGEIVPVETELLGETSATMSLDWITGEPAPESFVPGATLPAGAVNAGDSTARLRARSDFASSQLVAMLRPGFRETVASAARGGWHRVSAIWVPAVLSLAVVGFLAWLPHGASHAASVATAILVATCPCALGLANPLAVDLALGTLRRRGIFVRREDFFDRALRVRHIVFDKTGTLTGGALTLTAKAAAELDALQEADRDALYSMTARSDHPMSRGIAAALAERGARLLDDAASPVREVTGRGLEWSRGDACHVLTRSGMETVFSIEGREVARISFDEALRPDAQDEIRELTDSGYAVHLLSGDASERVARAAAALGIRAHRVRAQASPEEKAAYVRSIDRADTLMVGDGLNDAPAFVASHCAATPAIDRPALPSRSDFFFLGEGVDAVRCALDAAHRLGRVVRGNLAFALAYNAAVLSLCFAGVMTPVVAAVLMPASSIGVVAWTAVRMRPEPPRWK